MSTATAKVGRDDAVKGSPTKTVTAEQRKQDLAKLKDALDPVMFRLYQQSPFWALIIERCTFHMSYTIPTACVTEDAKVYISPEFFLPLSIDQQSFVVAHEVGHVVFQHHQRRSWRPPSAWNIAIDHALNIILVDDMGRQCLPEGVLYDPDKYRDKTAEEIFATLPEEMKNPSQGGAGSGPGEGMSGDLSQEDPGDDGVFREARDSTPETKEEWDAVMAQAATRCKMQGKLPGGLERAVNKHLNPEVSWREKLRTKARFALVCSGRDHYRMLPPNRRFISSDLYFPSMYAYKPRLCVVVDTSGSMSDKDMSIAYAEINSIRKVLNADVYVMSNDAQAYDGQARWVRPFEELPAFVGGGGTDFRPPFEHVEEKNLNPDLLVFFTDTWGAFPDDAPDYEVLWVIHGPDGKVPWGDYVHVGT